MVGICARHSGDSVREASFRVFVLLLSLVQSSSGRLHRTDQTPSKMLMRIYQSVLGAFHILLLGRICSDSFAERIAGITLDRRGRRLCCAQSISSLKQYAPGVGDWSLPSSLQHAQYGRSGPPGGPGVIGVDFSRRPSRAPNPGGCREHPLKFPPSLTVKYPF